MSYLLSLSFFLFLSAAPALAAGQGPPDITVFFTSDTRGMLRRCGCSDGQMGGLSARASYIKANRVAGQTLVLDAGDTLFDGPKYPPERREFYRVKAGAIIGAMGESGYDAVAVGEYDLCYGLDFLRDVSGAGFPFICANLEADEGCKPFRPYVVKEVGAARVAVVAALDPEFPYHDFADSFEGLTITDPVAAVNKAVKSIKGKADVIIVLAHLSVTSPVEFAGKLTGVDIVVQGHSAELADGPEKVGGALLVNGFYKGKKMGRLDLWLGKGGKPGQGIADYKYSVIDIDESIPSDVKVEEIIAGYRSELQERKFDFSKPDPPGAGAYVSPRVCEECHKAEYENWSMTAHARSYEALARTGDQYDPECLVCHTTGYGWKSGYKVGGTRQGLYNVTCESCHGRAFGHVSPDLATQLKPPVSTAISRAVPEKTCLTCHDEENSPRFQYGPYLEKGGAHGGPAPVVH